MFPDFCIVRINGIHGTPAIIFVLQPIIFIKFFESLFNTVLGHDGLICDEVGWWSWLNKGGDKIYDVEIGLSNTVEGKSQQKLHGI